jgi:hypothetical protein
MWTWVPRGPKPRMTLLAKPAGIYLTWSIAGQSSTVLRRTNCLLSLIRHGPHWKLHVQQFFYCCVCIRYRSNISAEPLPSNDRGIFTEPLRSNDKGDTQTHTHTQTATWSHKPTLFCQNKRTFLYVLTSRLQTNRVRVVLCGTHLRFFPWPYSLVFSLVVWRCSQYQYYIAWDVSMTEDGDERKGFGRTHSWSNRGIILEFV